MTWKKVITYSALALATYGTFRNNSGIPLINNHITKDGAGILIGLKNRIGEGVNYDGISVSLITRIDEGVKYKGLLVSGANANFGKINGVELGLLFNIHQGTNSQVNGLEMSLLGNMVLEKKGLVSLPSLTRGVQIGLMNSTRDSENCLQIGLSGNYGGSQ